MCWASSIFLFSGNDENGDRDEVNPSNGGAVATGSQGISPQSVLRMDFANGVSVQGNGPAINFTLNEHELVNNVSFAINQVTPTSTLVNLIVRLFDADDDMGPFGSTGHHMAHRSGRCEGVCGLDPDQ